ncbi:hypothetical protein GOP47_0006353 [Adiantum capillus-veneris]|uniref:Uncharacterized protein n=1 Tax=Adiantum capillus-veneris TaxID=13818 RepID=A0A9D4ZLY6_ADICA|nr:hypothetical protein GOP47_0006353 [Adiantum capillus-veneris]
MFSTQGPTNLHHTPPSPSHLSNFKKPNVLLKTVSFKVSNLKSVLLAQVASFLETLTRTRTRGLQRCSDQGKRGRSSSSEIQLY